MAITVSEKPESRGGSRGDSENRELIYTILGTSDDGDAYDALEEASPTVYDGLVRRSWSVKAVGVDEEEDAGTWEGTVQYGLARRLPPPKTGEKILTFDTGGGSMHITQSIQTLNSYVPTGKTAEDFGGAIGVTHDAIEGVDVGVPAFNFTATYYMPAAEVNADLVEAFHELSQHVNEESYSITFTRPPITLTFGPHELLLLNVSGGPRSEDDYELAFKFSAQHSMSDLEVGDITGIHKDGWAYMWVRYADKEGATAVLKKPVQVNVEQVLYSGDFTRLGSLGRKAEEEGQ